ncbi:MAG: hypothetical protein GX751_10325 [Desulfuromonadaceae bacterium]|nr:hypothetical protein [Desulfuromonadaceae bacterium]
MAPDDLSTTPRAKDWPSIEKIRKYLQPIVINELLPKKTISGKTYRPILLMFFQAVETIICPNLRQTGPA